MRTTLQSSYDPLDPAVLDNPYPTYAKLRQAGPVCRGGPGQWVVPRYAEVAALLSDQRLGHQFPQVYHRLSVGDGPASAFREQIILNRDPPEHTRLRQLMNQAFSPTLVRRLSDHIGELVDELLEPALDVGQLDVVTDLAFPLPVMVVCELIGIPATERNSVRPRAIDLCKAFGTRIPDHNRASANEAVIWLRDYIEGLINERRKAPADDLLSRMLAAQEGDFRFTVSEIIDNVAFLFFAGFETTMNLIATGCSALLKNPGELRRLRTEPSIVTTAVEEFLRYDAPIQSVARLVREPIEIDGRTIRSGRVLILLLGSANHDECQFFEPEKLNIGRKPNPHVSFGGGIHHCLGAALARVEAAVVFGRVAQRFSVFEPAGEVVRQPSASFRTYASVPVTVKPK